MCCSDLHPISNLLSSQAAAATISHLLLKSSCLHPFLPKNPKNPPPILFQTALPPHSHGCHLNPALSVFPSDPASHLPHFLPSLLLFLHPLSFSLILTKPSLVPSCQKISPSLRKISISLKAVSTVSPRFLSSPPLSLVPVCPLPVHSGCVFLCLSGCVSLPLYLCVLPTLHSRLLGSSSWPRLVQPPRGTLTRPTPTSHKVMLNAHDRQTQRQTQRQIQRQKDSH